jgi:hypothetical protein
MRSNTLTFEEKTLLQHCLKEHAPELLDRVELLDSELIDIDTVNKMRNSIGDELAGKGFNKDWSPTEYGLKLEDLIDRLANLYIWTREKK